MQKSQLEAWVYRIVDRVKANQPVEDDRVELKGAWIDAGKAARLVAGHANASHGEPILWLMGLDERIGVTTIDPGEFSNWYSQFKSPFDEGVSPDLLHHVNVPVDGKTVVALYFATDRAPYVVKNDASGRLEVPWRQGISTNPAKRSQLLRALAPVVKLPRVEVLKAELEVKSNEHRNVPDKAGPLEWLLFVDLYFMLLAEEPILIPKWQTLAFFEVPGMMPRTQFSLVEYATRHASPVDRGAMDLRVKGTGLVCLDFQAYTGQMASSSSGQPAKVVLELLPLDAERPVKTCTTLASSEVKRGGFNAWSFRLNPNGVNLLL